MSKQPTGYRYTLDEKARELDNLNPAVNDTAELIIPDFEGFNYFITNFTIPSIVIPKVETPFMGNNLSQIGDAIIYGEFSLDFMVDEDLSNYTALVEWVKLQAHNNDVQDRWVDMTIHWKTRNLHHKRDIVLHKAFVTDIGSFTIVTNNTDQDPLICSLTLAYQYLTIGDIKET